MELRARIRTQLRRAAIAGRAGRAPRARRRGHGRRRKAKKTAKLPVITKVSPMRAAIGDTLTIQGQQLPPRRDKNTVVFKRDGGRAVFVKAAIGTAKLLRVRCPRRS